MKRTLAAALALLAACADPPPPPRGVVLVLVDTLRADRVGCYGYERRPTTPHLDRLAAEGVLFESAISHAPWTLAAMTSLLSGFPDDRAFDGELRRSLVQVLSAAGVRTAAFTEGGFFTNAFGLGLGFDRFEEDHYLFGGGVERTFENGLAWLDEHGDAPFFLLLHTYEAHMPYLRTTFVAGLDPGRVGEHFTEEDHEALAAGEVVYDAAELAYLEALYDGGVHEADRWIGKLLDGLAARGLADSTAVIVTSDHGEELSEQRFPEFTGDHGHAFFDYLLHVPLIVADPRHRSGRRVAAQVRSMDVLPTVMEMLGVELPPDVEGRSLLALVAGEDEELERTASGGSPGSGPDRDFVRVGGYKLIRSYEESHDRVFAGLERERLYDLGADPREGENLAPQREALLRVLRERLERAHGGPGIALDELDVPAELAEQLRALGYATSR